ncbi:MAG: RNHCP domain-containing protein [Patescibacteria group bacterium]|nr:RNHCP domain-containing protein [Patescibacteria group bacterium]
MTKRFKRTVENFKCENCGVEVFGNGYTDHCPECLWGKHVDIYPGDRAARCGGAMKPIGIEVIGGRYRIRYLCQKCDHEFVIHSAKNDNFEEILKITKRM